MIRSKMYRTMIATMFGAMLGLALPVQTVVAQTTAETLLTHTDKNKDGMVSRAEFMESTQAMFDKMDKDKKGMMSMDAAKKTTDKALANLLTHTKTGDDKMIMRDAFMKHAGEMFDKMDTEKKGMMSMDAFKKFIEQLSQSAG